MESRPVVLPSVINLSLQLTHCKDFVGGRKRVIICGNLVGCGPNNSIQPSSLSTSLSLMILLTWSFPASYRRENRRQNMTFGFNLREKVEKEFRLMIESVELSLVNTNIEVCVSESSTLPPFSIVLRKLIDSILFVKTLSLPLHHLGTA